MISKGHSRSPALIMVDNSFPIISACLHQFSDVTLPHYIDRAHRIVTQKAQRSNMNLTFLHIRTHTMKRNVVMVDK